MGSSYTFLFSKQLDLSRSNGKKKKKTIINNDILIRISFIISYLWHSIPIFKPKKKVILFSLFLLHRSSTSTAIGRTSSKINTLFWRIFIYIYRKRTYCLY